ncbi:MAG: hydantoinase B/oxoprolinase family protein [Actinobacteria bacterium]|nr:hydantoinase B/oxoprolinase family protein [Actinomycetota bacterium]
MSSAVSAGERPEVDPVTAAIVAGKLGAVVDDMATTLANVAPSRLLSTSRAFACALLDERGEVVTIDSPTHLPTVQETVANCLDAYQFDIASDDVIVTNDPYGGGSSVHHLTLVAPVGIEEETVAYLAVQAHMADIGGTVIGNYNPIAWELWQEGARFTPLKVVVEGKRRRSAIDTLLLNGRQPAAYRGDLEAVLATANVGRERVAQLVAEQGLERTRQGMETSIVYAERRFRAALARLPEGEFEGAATLDHDGQGRRDLSVRVSLRRDGEDGVALDFSASDEQSAGFVNSPRANTVAFGLLPLLGLIDDSVPRNAGLLRALAVTTRPGTLVDPTYPAPTGWCRDHVGCEIAESVGVALAAALPEEGGVLHASQPLLFTVDQRTVVGGVEEQLRRSDFVRLAQPGSAASAHGDGWGAPGTLSRGLFPSIEEFEAENAVAVERLEYVTDSGGVGEHRGAPATEVVIRLGEGDGERLFAAAAGVVHGPAGWAGGGGGGGAELRVGESVGEEEAEIEDVVFDRPLAAAARLRIRAAAGGGWGDPRRRDPERVRADVLGGYVSAPAAAELYGQDVNVSTSEEVH